ncbi:putative amidase PB8B6.03 [Grifola frondosa]|uniref:amidase n=1 Tax=Grifola frondosa TaxID=5627 RepID=A0A1C7M9P0_GRIFR|nr:putative amidase PB8B6.03 [Grifola frondosa]
MLFPSCSSYLDIVQKKQAERDAALQSHAPPEAHEPYLRATASEIVQRIAKGDWTASDVLEAYITRATLAQDTTNCLTEVLFAEAREDANSLDREFAATHTLRGPLHGVPVSFKDQYDIRGHDTTLGFTSRADHPAAEDADVSATASLPYNHDRSCVHPQIVRIVRAAGGIPLAKTNVPQTLFFFECVNPLWGRTLNPHSAAHSSGGSSGGEAALLAMDGSALGWGTDIGGSLRIPASFCGIYSLKPGAGRISTQGMQTTTPGFEGVRTVTGPMGRSVDDLELATRVVLGQGTDSGVAPLPFRDAALPEKLRFGYYLSGECMHTPLSSARVFPRSRILFAPLPFSRSVRAPVLHLFAPAGVVHMKPGWLPSSVLLERRERAVSETVEALRRVGHECVEIKVPEGGRAMDLFIAMTSADGYKTLTSQLGSDPQEPGLFLVMLGPKLFGWLRVLVAWGLETFLGDSVFAQTIRASRKKDVQEYHKLVAQRDEYEKLFYKEVRRFRVGEAPAGRDHRAHDRDPRPPARLGDAAHAARGRDDRVQHRRQPRRGRARHARRPVGRSRRGVDGGCGARVAHAGGLVFGDGGAKKGWYDAAAMAGLPVGVQVVGRRWEEEKVLGMMRVVDGALGERGFGPGSWSAQGV